MKDIRIAAVTMNSPVGETDGNISRTEKWIKKAADAGASIICFPEMNITGYSSNDQIAATAETSDGQAVQKLLRFADQDNMVILAGIIEIDDNGCLYATHLSIQPGGNMDIYRKLYLAPPEKGIFTAGSSIPLFEACEIKFGIQLCYDAHFPELSTFMAENGTDVIFMPHASPRGTPEEKYISWMRHLPARAYDNSLFIIACNQLGENRKDLHFPGVIMALNPSGSVIKKKLTDKEAMIIVDLKSDDLEKVRNHRMRYFLPNRRPELY